MEASVSSEGRGIERASRDEALVPAVPLFDEFFTSNYESLVRALFLITGDVGDAEDSVQEGMARALQRWERVGGMTSAVGYVYATAVNIHRRTTRRRALQVRYMHSLARQDPASDPHNALEIRSALQALPVRLRAALVLVDWLGFTSVEAADVLGIRASALRTRLHRGRQALKASLGGGVQDES
jgi:RNA polymerase sigma-70 factor (ECF subfamily)